MKKSLFLSLLLTFLTTFNVWSQHTFRFHDGKFRIAQFTDIHWDAKSANCKQTSTIIQKVIQTEKPDIAILTGDIVTEQPAAEGWKSIIQIFENSHLPFVVVMGNHDAEVMSKKEIYQQLTASPYYAGCIGATNITGYGNCSIPIYSSNKSSDQPAALIYCIDSNDYQPIKEYGAYDWIHFDQIQWYRTESKKYTQANSNKPLPALAFFHIPLVEFKHVVARNDYLGNYGDGEVCSSNINSGMFASFIDMKDVMGVFCGHDHDNDFIGMEYDIALGYGRVSGLDAYGKVDRGGRIIELYEGQRKFDTWVRTSNKKEDTFYYPSALTSKDERTMNYLPAKPVKPSKQGVAYTYFEGKIKHTKDIHTLKKVESGTMKNFFISNAKQNDHFAYIFRAYIQIKERGVYRFYTYSDDGSKLLIDNQLVVDNDGGHSARRAEGKVALEPGFHEIEVRYFEDYMGQELEVGYASRNITERPLPDNILFLPQP